MGGFGPVLRSWVLFPLLLAACGFVRAEPAATLEIGILPNISSRILLGQYQPLREYLERVLMRPVQVSTAPDWQSFYARARSGEYAITITAAHLARLHQIESGHVPLVLFTPGIKALLVVDKDKPVGKVGDLRGTTLALSNPKSLVTLQGMQWLAEQGLRRGENLRTLNTPTDDSVGNLVLNGDCVAALISGGEFKAIPDVLRNRLQIFQQIAEVPGFVALAAPGLPATEVFRIKRALLDFTRNPDESSRFFAATGFQGFVDATEVQMKPLDIYLRETRRIVSE